MKTKLEKQTNMEKLLYCSFYSKKQIKRAKNYFHFFYFETKKKKKTKKT